MSVLLRCMNFFSYLSFCCFLIKEFMLSAENRGNSIVSLDNGLQCILNIFVTKYIIIKICFFITIVFNDNS